MIGYFVAAVLVPAAYWVGRWNLRAWRRAYGELAMQLRLREVELLARPQLPAAPEPWVRPQIEIAGLELPPRVGMPVAPDWADRAVGVATVPQPAATVARHRAIAGRWAA